MSVNRILYDKLRLTNEDTPIGAFFQSIIMKASNISYPFEYTMEIACKNISLIYRTWCGRCPHSKAAGGPFFLKTFLSINST